MTNKRRKAWEQKIEKLPTNKCFKLLTEANVKRHRHGWNRELKKYWQEVSDIITGEIQKRIEKMEAMLK